MIYVRTYLSRTRDRCQSASGPGGTSLPRLEAEVRVPADLDQVLHVEQHAGPAGSPTFSTLSQLARKMTLILSRRVG